MQNDISRIRQKLIPMVEDIVINWLAVYFVTTTPTESPSVEDFSSRLSSLHIGNFLFIFFSYIFHSLVLWTHIHFE